MPSECRSPHRSSSASCFLFSPKAFCSIIRLKAFNPQACVTVIMARVWLGFNLLFCFLMSTIGLDVNLIQVPTTDGVSGVFLVQTKTSQYSFNATTAKEACEFIQMRIATKAEVETANKNGLQTCRFGWIEEQIAVIPRVDRNENCGKNKVGVSVWRADISKKFDVFCFKGPEPFHTTTSRTPTRTGGRTPSTFAYSTEASHPSSTKSTSSPAHTSTSPPPSTSISPASSSFITVTHSIISDTSQRAPSAPAVSSSNPPPKFLTSFPSSSSHSNTYFLFQPAFSTDTPTVLQNTTANRQSVRGSKIFVIILFVLMLVMAVAGAAWYLKMWEKRKTVSILEQNEAKAHC
ncbi:hypothetical protein DNTS_002831 [Danionella cerebrum]|uniref:Link domain-containing protein n=1 Tax=Danionella cerebrum TaxID=2873325 RepID=A0A553QF39_9TELE|nr:hypothetical protein DNTS_002831 [Danionella translucida]